jgi:CRP-like cAMP-binding protein
MLSHSMPAPHAAITPRPPVPIRPSAALPVQEPDNWLHAKGMRMRLDRDDVLFSEGDDAHRWYKVVSGAIRIVKILADGRRYVVDFFLPGDFIGFDAATSYEFTAEAIVESELVSYPRLRVDAALEENPQAGHRLLELALRRLAAAQNQMLLLGRMSAMERIATFLLTLQRRLGDRTPGAATISLAMTRLDIADHLGLTLETVSRMLNQLKRQGVIDLPHPQRICIVKPERLRALAVGASA